MKRATGPYGYAPSELGRSDLHARMVECLNRDASDALKFHKKTKFSRLIINQFETYSRCSVAIGRSEAKPYMCFKVIGHVAVAQFIGDERLNILETRKVHCRRLITQASQVR